MAIIKRSFWIMVLGSLFKSGAKLSRSCVRFYSKMEASGRVVDLQSLGELTCVETALTHLRRGEVIAFPTDTIYGISCLAQNTDGIRQLYDIKRRDLKKPVAICVGDVSDVGRYAVSDGVPSSLLSTLLPGAVTVVLQRRDCLNPSLNPAAQLVGVRVPNHPLSRALALAAGEALALTSANVSSEPSCVKAEEFRHLWPQLGAVLDGGVITQSPDRDNEPSRQGSTVVDLSQSGTYRIIRPGCALETTQSALHSHGWTQRTD